jgi:hypothetical protein
MQSRMVAQDCLARKLPDHVALPLVKIMQITEYILGRACDQKLLIKREDGL